MDPVDRRNFLQLWFQALLMAIFPSLFAQPKVLEALAAKAAEIQMEQWGWTANYVVWQLVRGYDLRWQIGQNQRVLDEHLRSRIEQNQQALDELLTRTAYDPSSTSAATST